MGIESDATYDEAKSAYRRLAEIFHPDRFADARPEIQNEAERQMKDLNAAWRTLRVRFGHEDEGEIDPNRFDRWAKSKSAGEPRDRQWAQPDDFSTRARQARTRERAQERRTSTDDRTSTSDEQRAAEAAAQAEREAFVRDARDRLLREEGEAASPSGG
jgi:curved DNA-binding protein CbpA